MKERVLGVEDRSEKRMVLCICVKCWTCASVPMCWCAGVQVCRCDVGHM